MNNWQRHIHDSRDLLLSLSVTDINGQDIDTDTAFKQLQNYALGVLERRKTIYFIGNGSSASIANDVSSALAQYTGIRTETFFNFTLLTAIANNSSYDEIFVEPIRKKMIAGDLLVAISRSGESQNIINAVREALTIGCNVCTLSSFDPENTLRSMGTLNFYIHVQNPMNAYLCHMEIMNYWAYQMISVVSWQNELNENFIHDNNGATVINNWNSN